MFKQTTQSEKETMESTPIIDKLNAVTLEQRTEFAKLTGRFEVDFKIGKPSNGAVR